MKYTVRMDSHTCKVLARLPDDMHSRIMRKLDALQDNLLPPASPSTEGFCKGKWQ